MKSWSPILVGCGSAVAIAAFLLGHPDGSGEEQADDSEVPTVDSFHTVIPETPTYPRRRGNFTHPEQADSWKKLESGRFAEEPSSLHAYEPLPPEMRTPSGAMDSFTELLAGENLRSPKGAFGGRVPGDDGYRVMEVAGTISQASVDQLEAGVGEALAAIQANFVSQVLAESLPLLGDNLAEAANAGSTALAHVTNFRNAVTEGLGTLTGSETYTEAQAEQAMGNALVAAGIANHSVNVDTSNPAEPKIFFGALHSYPAFAANREDALGLPGVGFGMPGGAGLQVALTYNLSFAVGLDAEGFYFNTANNASLLSMTFAVTMPGLDVTATLSRLRFRVSEGTTAGTTSFNGTFGIDLLDPSGADDRLRTTELGGDLINAVLSGNAYVNLMLESDLGTADFPAITADFRFEWAFFGGPVVPGDDNAGFGVAPYVAFRNVKVDLGSFFTDFARPVLGTVRDVTAPVQPVIDGLKEQIPILEALEQESGQSVPSSLLEYLEFQGVLTSQDIDRINLLDAIINLANSVPTDGGGATIDLGDFDIAGADPRAPGFSMAQANAVARRFPPAAVLQNVLLEEFIDDVDALPSAGMQFPVVEDPSCLFGMLLGKDVEFFTYDAPDLALEPKPEFNEFFRLAGPLGIRLQGFFDVRAKLDFGYDSRGILDFATGGFNNPELIFDGFYVVDQEGAEAFLDTNVQASMAVNVVIGEAGAGGGLTGHAEAAFEDPTPGDGKIRASELLDGLTSGCLFHLSGDVTASLHAYVTVGVDPFDHTFTFDGPSSELVNFSGHFCDDEGGTPAPPILAHREGDDIVLHVGADAFRRLRGSVTDIAEGFRVGHGLGGAGNETVGVIALGLEPQAYTAGPGGSITGNGGDFDDVLALDADVLTPAILSGGFGNDSVIGGMADDTLAGDDGFDILLGNDGDDQLVGGAGFDHLDAGVGNDDLDGGPGNDLLIGGPGGDAFMGGPGDDAASYVTSDAGIFLDLDNLALSTGDAAGDEFTDIERYFGSPHADTLSGTTGNDYLAGEAGNDAIYGREGSDLLVGGPGADTLDGGPGVDFASYLSARAGVAMSLVTGGTVGDAAGDTFAAIENVEGSDDFSDVLEGDHNANWLRGYGGDNTLRGLGGDDLLDGAKDDDTLEGGDGNDTLRADIDGAATIVTSSGSEPATLPAGGNDTLLGGNGDDILDGGAGDDQMDGGADNDHVLPGAGEDIIAGGSGMDWLEGGEDDDVIEGGDDDDVIDAGNGNDSASGGNGNDIVRGDAGNDDLAGNAGTDRLEGGEGNDSLAVGSLRQATQDPFRDDHLFAGPGFDVISADFSNQSVPIEIIAGPSQSLVFGDGTEAHDFELVHDLATGSGADLLRLDGAADDGFGNLLRTGFGNDVIFSGDGNDIVDAGDGDDYVNGGHDSVTLLYSSQAVTGVVGVGDVLTGGPGIDTVAFDQLRHLIDAYNWGLRPLGVNVDLATNQTGNAALGIVISGFENIVGTDAADELRGDDGPNIIMPLRGGGFSSRVTSGPDRVWGRGGEDTLRIDFSLEDLPGSTGVMMNGQPGGPVNPYGGYRRLTPDAAHNEDSVAFEEMERAEIIGTSKRDEMGPVNYNRADILEGRNGNDVLWGLGGSDTLLGGEGDDALYGLHTVYWGDAGDPAADTDGHDVFDAGPGNDYVEDFFTRYRDGAEPEPTLAPGTLLQLDGGPGFDTLSADFGNETDPVIWHSISPTDIVFSSGAYARNFEDLRYFRSGSGNDVFTHEGRSNQWFITRNGNDVIRPGLGRDQVNGGAGDDLIIVDYSVGDTPDLTGIFGYGGPTLTLRRDSPTAIVDTVDAWGIERMDLTGSSKADTLIDLYGDDIIRGGGGNDLLRGVFGGKNRLYGEAGDDIIEGGQGDEFLSGGTGNDILPGGGGNDLLDGGGGPAEIDRLHGGGGADLFILGNPGHLYYDDGNSGTPGHDGYAWIEEFRPSEGDRLQLADPASNYLLGTSPFSSPNGPALYHDTNANGVIDPATDELIAVWNPGEVLTPANTLDTALLAQSVVLSAAGLENINVGFSGERPTLQFLMNSSLPAGAVLDLEASDDLGTGDAWQTIASNYRNGSWTGLLEATTAPAIPDKVQVTLVFLDTAVSPPRRFFRFALRPVQEP